MAIDAPELVYYAQLVYAGIILFSDLRSGVDNAYSHLFDSWNYYGLSIRLRFWFVKNSFRKYVMSLQLKWRRLRTKNSS